MNLPTTQWGRVRGVAVYVAAWSPLVVLYAILIGRSAQLPASVAINAAISTVLWGALLGAVVLWVLRRWHWPEQLSLRVVLVHVGMAFLYGAAWDALIMVGIRAGMPTWRSVLEEVTPWIHWQTFEGILIYGALAGTVWARANAQRVREQQERMSQLDALRVRAELDALRGRLDPHFLFNTLHTVSVLIRRDPVAAEDALERLSTLLRYVLDAKQGARDAVPLADELAFTDAYLGLEALRLGDRLVVERQIDPDVLDHPVPSFVLQSLVENAIKHGVAPHAKVGTIRIAGRVEASDVVLTVDDNGPGVTTDPSGRTGVGLDTLRKRIAALTGGVGRLDVATAPGAGFAVTVRLPA
jgi:two-component system, LytTR family, sensor kinase